MQILWRDEMLGLSKSARRARWAAALATACLLCSAGAARALVIAGDDASQSAYIDGWQNGDNGGSGFNAWTNIGNQSGSGSGGGFLASNNSNSQINSSGEAWGIFGNGGGVGQAFRPFAPGSTLQPGWTFSLDMDNGFIDTGGTVGFGLQNSSSQNLAEFFFVGGDPSYKVNRSGGSVASGVGFTNQGLHLSFTLTSANSFSMQIDQLSDGLGTNVTTVSGNLISQTGGQSVAQLRLFNANAGFNGDHDAFFNNLSISVVPEAPAVAFGGMICGVMGIAYGFRSIRTMNRTRCTTSNVDCQTV
jgi:hypothetical protein